MNVPPVLVTPRALLYPPVVLLPLVRVLTTLLVKCLPTACLEWSWEQAAN